MHKIPFIFEYQACNDTSSLAPQSTEHEVEITVVDSHTTIKKINSEIFSKIKFDRSPQS
jgi:hypothetical protein